MKPARRGVKVLVFFLFAALAFVHLLPLTLHPRRGVTDGMDTLLVAWIMTRLPQNLLAGAPLLDGKAFFPYDDSLRFSELFGPQAAVAYPVSLVSRNPLLAYNAVFFLSFVFAAFAMYLLVRDLTENDFAAVAAGAIFAFSSYPMMHTPHLQLLTTGFIPLAFRELHRFARSGAWKNAFLFALYFLLQGLSCIYYGLFFSSVLLVVLPVFAVLTFRRLGSARLAKLAAAVIPAGGILALFSLPYRGLFEKFAFFRELAAGADLGNYFAPIPRNVVWGKILSPLGQDEAYLFPGLAALVFLTVFLMDQAKLLEAIPKWWRRALLAVMGAAFILSGLLLATRGFDLSLGPLRITGHDPDAWAALFVLSALATVVSALVFDLRRKGDGAESGTGPVFLYIFLFIWALFLSFGSEVRVFGRSLFADETYGVLFTPFRWLFQNIPGFRGVRAPSRYAVFVLLAGAVLAGFGLTRFLGAFRTRRNRLVVAVALLLVLNVEFLAVPQRTVLTPSGEDIPPVYRWLKEQPGDFAVLELPVNNLISRDALFLYFSLFHGKRLVNGYSGFLPPATLNLRSVFRRFPIWENIEILRALDIRYLVVHMKGWTPHIQARTRERLATLFAGDVREVRRFSYAPRRPHSFEHLLGEDVVYEVLPGAVPRPPARPAELLPPERWSLSANINKPLLAALKDGNLESSWTTRRPKRSWDYLTVIMDEAAPVAEVRLRYHPADVSYQAAVTVAVETSLDGTAWKNHEFSYAAGDFIRGLVDDPRNPVQRFFLPGEPVRFVRMTQFGDNEPAAWTVAEVEVLFRK